MTLPLVPSSPWAPAGVAGEEGTAREGLLLALDASSTTGSVALGNRDGVVAEVSVSSRSSHSSTLLLAVDQVLRSACAARTDLSGVVVGAGPGSFTGLRIAAATAKGIARGLGVPLLAYSSLLSVAVRASSATGKVCAVFDARGRDVYAALYSFADGIRTLLDPVAIELGEMIERIQGENVTLLVGDGATRHRQELESRVMIRIAPSHFSLPSASALVWLAVADREAGRIRDVEGWEPAYLRASGAERIAAARLPRGPSS